ncbi:MAG: YihA family ribosome biogenesis GTP-binding protein [Candidatus Omnitrophica bacterium]|nr:YihA family ribosome biogenesis GTP-binding protein [Candidatus Omnitrophota bacterium]MCA9415491.1 YihA family ribosome biogenesis GTP-binding protein [Candidatus Omnitrophota bacterium]MCA9423986.1 YihA family ribosome biogenesis GTP-binding protein [Candidatus Omnitrophota bacterium]MCA9429751.1 YihA family ribosome biogenesis GTP-binding protein [Candidatus Omnitrophota bacterium]MCA9440733.1 YihA family ribosome biogenesis GTP-binding protein [Candidatus Omnitrophota bacterium]
MVFQINSIEFMLSAVSVGQFPSKELPEFAFSGRSNVGKSSLLNLLTGRKGIAKVSRTPGKTRAVNFFEVDKTWRLVDLPGYGYARLSKKEIEKWGRVIDSYLRDRTCLAGVVQLIDSRHKPTQLDLSMMNWLAQTGIPTVIALTKIDKLKKNDQRNVGQKFRKDWLRDLSWPIVSTSAERGVGREELLLEVERILNRNQ